MKLTKTNIILLIINLTILPLLGNKDLINILHIELLSNILNYILPSLLVINLIHTIIKNKYKFKLDIKTILLLIFIISLLISLIFSITYKGYTFTNLYKFIVLPLILYLLSLFNIDNKKINKSILITAIIISLFGISQYIFNFELTTHGIEKYIGSIGRIKSTFLIATIFDKYLSIIIIYILYLLINNKENKYLLIITYILSFISLCLTYSRTGLLITLINLTIIVLYLLYKKKYIYLLIIPITIGIMLIIPGEKYVLKSIDSVFNSKIKEIINKKENNIEKTNNDNQIETGNDYSVISRESYMDVAKKIIKNKPITGIGIGNYTYIYENQNVNDYIKDTINYHYLYPHNMYYQLAAEIGIIGLITFYLLFIYILGDNKNIYSYLLLLIILASSITESIFYIKDIAYFIVIMSNLLPRKKKI